MQSSIARILNNITEGVRYQEIRYRPSIFNVVALQELYGISPWSPKQHLTLDLQVIWTLQILQPKEIHIAIDRSYKIYVPGIQVLGSSYHFTPPSQGMTKPLQSRIILASIFFILPLNRIRSPFNYRSFQLRKALLSHRLLLKTKQTIL